MSKVENATEQISSVFYNWLQAEVNSSMDENNRNSILDDYDSAIKGLKGGWDHKSNFTARKFESHIMRLPLWLEAYSYDPEDDYQAARLLFAGLMQVSGSYRNQCYLQARNPEDYVERRKDVIGTNMHNAVGVRLHTHLPSTGNFARANIELDDLEKRMQETIKVGETSVRAVCNRTKYGYDLGQSRSRSVNEMQIAQYNWLTFATDCLTHSVKVRRGNLADVPFLEAKSISDEPKVYYPLAA